MTTKTIWVVEKKKAFEDWHFCDLWSSESEREAKETAASLQEESVGILFRAVPYTRENQ